MSKPSPTLADYGVLFIRLMLAVVFVYHGGQKLFGIFGGHGIDGFAGGLEKMGVPMPQVSAYLAACAEFFGGLSLLTGLLLRLMAIPLAFTMFVAAFSAHWPKFDVREGGMEYPLTLAFVVVGLGLIGPGSLTVWRLFSK